MFNKIQKITFKLGAFLLAFTFLLGLNGLTLFNDSFLNRQNFSITVLADESEVASVEDSTNSSEESNNSGGSSGSGGFVGSGDIFNLNILGTSCIFPGQEGCDGENNLVDQIRIFLFGLGNAVAVVVLMYGGFKYFFSGVAGGAEDGKKAVMNGIIGLVLVNAANFLTSLITGGGDGDGVVTDSGLNAGPIRDFLVVVGDNFLLPLSSVVAVIVVAYGGYQYMFSSMPNSKTEGMGTIKKGVIGLVVVLLSAPVIGVINQTINTDESNLNLNTNPVASFFVGNILAGLVIPAATVVSVFFVVWGGYLMITSHGNSTKYEHGTKALINSLIGLVIVLLSTTIVALVALFADI